MKGKINQKKFINECREYGTEIIKFSFQIIPVVDMSLL